VPGGPPVARDAFGRVQRVPQRLHVAVPRTASRLKHPDDARLPFAASPGVALHWTDPADLVGTERTRVASPALLLRHAFLTLPPEQALAILDSALHQRFLRPADLHALAATLPARLRRVVLVADGRAESGIETIARHMLRLAGLQVEPQARIGGVGHVDLLVEGRLIVELDGREWHDEAFEEDRRRDLVSATQRYRTLRFSWYRVLFRWPEVEAAVFAALAS
jgi:very-short-patch-repair endonuclease